MPLPITLYECCFFAGNVGPLKADNYCSRNQNKIFQHFGRLFLAGTLKNVPFSVNELLVKFREESTGVGRFCRLEFERMANWPSFDFLSKLGQLSRRPVSIKKSKLGQLAIRWNFEPAKSANPNIEIDSSRKLTNTNY